MILGTQIIPGWKAKQLITMTTQEKPLTSLRSKLVMTPKMSDGWMSHMNYGCMQTTMTWSRKLLKNLMLIGSEELAWEGKKLHRLSLFKTHLSVIGTLTT